MRIAKVRQSYYTFLQQQQASDVAKQVTTYTGELQYLNNVIATRGATTANTVSDPELKGYNEQLTNLNNELTHWTSLKSQYNDYICQLYREDGSLGSEDDSWYADKMAGHPVAAGPLKRDEDE